MTRHRPTRRTLRRCSALGLCLLAAGLWGGCTQQKRYRVLSFFFDGVPDPSAATRPADGTRVMTRGGQALVLYFHKPYERAQDDMDLCGECHTGGGNVFAQTSTPDASVCAKCHQGVPRAYPVMHGPVAAGACLWCHEAHQSTVPHLLKATAPKICLQCHNPIDLADGSPQHKDMDRSCLDCHVGHGGPQRHLLRAGWSGPLVTSRPATQPATRPGDLGGGP